MDQAELTGVLNVMIRPTGPIRFTDTSLVMGNVTMDSDEFWLVLMFFSAACASVCRVVFYASRLYV